MRASWLTVLSTSNCAKKTLGFLRKYSERDLTLFLAKQHGPWPPPDIRFFIRIHEQELTGAFDLALLLAPGVLLLSIRVYISAHVCN